MGDVVQREVLNSEQRAAISSDGSVLLVACPGSGKTRTLTYKVAKELSALDDDDRRSVAAITYTNRAAEEIQDRIQSLGVPTDKLWVGTIHAFCLEWILKPYGAYHPDLKNGFEVIDAHERERLLTELCIPYKSYRVSMYDCDYYYTESGITLACKDRGKLSFVEKVLEEYFALLKERRQVDFELILAHSLWLVRNIPSSARILARLFTCIAVDEYQDTKRAQYFILGEIFKAGKGSPHAFIVGDPNQAIYGSLGGVAFSLHELESAFGMPMVELGLTRNYRSTEKIIGFFSHFRVYSSAITAARPLGDRPTFVTFDSSIAHVDLDDELVRLIRYNVEVLGVPPNELAIIAPWWMHLATITRRLMAKLPEYDFNGPGMVPFASDVENFWFKMARLALTEAAPEMYLSRLRWAHEVLIELERADVHLVAINSKDLLYRLNSFGIELSDGLDYLRTFFSMFCDEFDLDLSAHNSLANQQDAFFKSSQARIDRLQGEGVQYAGHVDSFRRAFKKRTGITVSTIHGVKGAEFDVVIAYALLEGMVPHFNDTDKVASAKKLMYVIGSRARHGLHLVSEAGRSTKFAPYLPTEILLQLAFPYDTVPPMNFAEDSS
ncbi:ATP-dependent helicase [Microbacteriaceae bacterium VKM Ac-2854]|nr:ATP-dependent helicase [Microbacteriaceae bacterium VKM Ac-2854]